jgi:translation initiation factor IF-3
VNHRIRARELRVIGPDGAQLGVLTPEVALAKAQELSLDLVEVSPTARPPVCKIMDYGKYKYDMKKKAAGARKNQHATEIKEIKFRPKIEDHDFETKTGHVKRFLLDGNKVKLTMMFRGREITHADIAKAVLDKVAIVLAVEQNPKLEGRNMTMLLAPKPNLVAQAGAAQQGNAPQGASSHGAAPQGPATQGQPPAAPQAPRAPVAHS